MTEEELTKIIKMPTACDRSMTLQEIYGVSRLLEGHHSLFYMIWEMGRPIFTNDLPTAAVVYDPNDKTGKALGWYMNPDFWDSIDNYTRAFVLGHESLHILFNHIKRHSLDKRYKVSEDGQYIYDDSRLANVAQDIVINHALLNTFGFDRNVVQGWQDWCWVDTIWPDDPNIPTDECFEYYYELLKDNIGKSASLRLMDSHEYFDLPEDVRNQIEKTLNKSLSEEEKKELRGMIEQHVVGGPDGGEEGKDGKEGNQSSKGGKQAGKDAVGAWIFVSKPKPVRKPKWETIVRDKVKMIIKNQYGMVEQWAQKQRNHMSLPSDMKLPADIEDYDIVMNKAKIDLVFFLDASGSCYSMADRFFKAAATVPRHIFNVHLCSFDTRVYQLDINSPKMMGGGGTSFHIMEDFIQAKLKSGEMKRYPDAVFVITDGYGDNVHPEKPKQWFWFMTEKYFNCIPNSSHKFMLSEFE